MALEPSTVIELHYHLDQLKKQHKELSSEIDHLLETQPGMNDLRIHRLKREKLALKDQITKIDALLVPDIIA